MKNIKISLLVFSFFITSSLPVYSQTSNAVLYATSSGYIRQYQALPYSYLYYKTLGNSIYVGDKAYDTEDRYRGFVEFDISSIPVGAQINSVKLTLDVFYDSNTPYKLDIHYYNDTERPSERYDNTTNNEDIWNTIAGSTTFINDDPSFVSQGGYEYTLGSTACTYIRNLRNSSYEYFMVGLHEEGDDDSPEARLYGANTGITVQPSLIVNYTVPPSLTVYPSSLTVGSSSGSQGSISVTSNVSWTASDDQAWLSVSPSSGSNNGPITVTASSTNPSTSSRSGTVTISGGGFTKYVTITQQGAPVQLIVSPSTLTIGSASGSQGSISVTSNVSWTISDDAAWLSISPTSGSNNGTVTVSATANISAYSRSATVTITGGGLTRNVSITQSGATPVLTAYPPGINLGSSSGSSEPITITSNLNWSASDDASWLSISPTSGSNNGTVTVTANSQNTTGSKRTATVTISGLGLTKYVNVDQNSVTYSLTVTPTTLSLASPGGSSGTVTVNSNVSWTATDDQSWLTVSPPSGSNNGTVTITATSENTSTSSRSGTVTISGDGITRTVTVTQSGAAATLTITPTTLSLASPGGSSGTVTVNSNVSWTASDDQTWLTVSPASGSNNGTVTITATSENTSTSSRSGIVTISGSGITRTVTVTQSGAAATLTITPTTLSLASPGGSSGTVTVNSNVSWTATDDQSWLNVSPASGSNNGTVTITAASENTSTSSRSGTVTISGNGITRTVTVTQSGAAVTLTITPTTLSLASASGSSGTVTVNSNVSWTATDDQSWLNVSPASGSNNGTVTITATSENTTTSSRSGTVTISGSGITRTVTVTQSGGGATLTVTPTALTLGSANGSNGTVTVNSNVSWTVTDDQTWITISPASGSNNGTITITAASENTTTNSRSGTITISGGGITRTVTVTQNGTAATLNVTPTALGLASASGSNGTVNVSSNIGWTVTDDQTWITISPASGSNNGTITITASSENTSASSRSGIVTISGGGIARNVTVAQSGTSITPYSVNLAVNPVGSGTVTGAGTYNSGTLVTVSATENTGYTFNSWTLWDSVVSTNKSFSFIINSNTSLVANFISSPQLIVTPTNLTLQSASGSEGTILVGSNVNWTVSDDAAWLTVSPSSGSNSGVITASAISENVSLNSRSCTITVTGGGLTRYITVTQNGTAVSIPPAPGLLSPANRSNNLPVNSSLSWNASSGATTYALQISTVNNFATILVNQSGISQTSFIPAGLSQGTKYYWRVNATNAAGTSSWSDVWEFSTIIYEPVNPPVLAAPMNGSTGISLTPILTWNSVEGATGYTLQVSVANNFSEFFINLSGLTTTSYSLTGLGYGTTYYWRVNASNPGGTSSWSAPFYFTTIISPPSTPVLINPVNGEEHVVLSPLLKWSAAPGAENYTLQVSTTINFSNILIDVSGLTATSYLVSGLNNGTRYYWRVKATNVGGSSFWSEIWDFKTVLTIPPPPLLDSPGNGISGVSLNSFLTWNTAPGASSYYLQVSTESNFESTIINLTGITGTNHPLSGLNNGTKYYWRVSAVNSGGASPWSEIWNFLTEVTAPPTPVLLSPANNSVGIAASPTLTWNRAPGAATYTLQVSTVASFASLIVNQPGLTVTNYSPAGLANGTKYYWRVNATNSGGTGNWSEVWNFTTIVALPPAPVLVTPVNGSAGVSVNPMFMWNVTPGAVSYNLQVSTESSFAATILNLSGLTTTQYSTTGLSSGTKYYWRVNAVNAGGTGSWSEVWNFTTILLPPETPVLAAPLNGSTSTPVNATLNWNPVSMAASYKLQISTTPNFLNYVVNLPGITSTSYLAAGLSNGTKYYWRVNAVNSGGTSSWSEVWNFTTTVPPPPTPVLLSPVNNETDVNLNPLLTWNSSSGAENYNVQVSATSNFSAPVINQSGITATNFSAPGLSNSTKYYWRVSAVNSGGTSSWSEVRNFTTIIALPTVPVLASPENGAPNIHLNTPLTWNPSAGAASYILQVSTVSNFSTLLINQAGITSTSFTPSGLTNGTIYFWKVRAVNIAGTSEWSTVWNFTTIIAPPPAPVLISPANGITELPVNPTLQWNSSQGAVNYTLQISTTSDFSSLLTNQTTPNTTYSVSGLNNYTKYYWRVNASNAGGTSLWSDVWTFTTVKLAPQVPVLASPANGSENVLLTAELTWNPSQGADSYILEVSNVSTFATSIIYQSAITSINYSLSGLSNSTIYYWRVKAVNSGGQSSWSSAWSFTTIQAAPKPILLTPGNNAVAISITPEITWNAGSGAESYTVQISNDIDFSNLIVHQSGITVKSFIPSGLSYNTRYYWRVQSVNAGGAGDWSDIFNFTTIREAPQLVSPADGSSNLSDNVNLDWHPVEGAVTYTVQVSTQSNFVSLITNQGGITATNLIVSGLSKGTKYYWRVSAVNSGGTSPWSAVWSFTTIFPPPVVPVLLSPKNGSIGEPLDVSLCWESCQGAESYQVQLSVFENFAVTLVNESGIKTICFSPTGLSCGTKYYWRVRAANSGGTSPWSDIREFTTQLLPINFTAELGDAEIKETETLSFTFRAEDPNPGMIVTYSLGAAPKGAQIHPSSGLFRWTPNYTQSGKYNMSVIASDGIMKDTSYSVITVINVNRPPYFTEVLKDDTIRVTSSGGPKPWQYTYETLQFQYKAADPDAGTALTYSLMTYPEAKGLIYYPQTGSFRWKPEMLTNSGLYIFYFTASDGEVSVTDTAFIHVPQATAVHDEDGIPQENALMQNYPNPFNPGTIIEYTLSNESKVRVTVYNSLGELVSEIINEFQSAGYYKAEFDAGNLPSGIYLYSISVQSTDGNENFHSVKKMLLIK